MKLQSGIAAGLLASIGVFLGGCDSGDSQVRSVANGDPKSGRLMIDYYQCGTCHHIPGIRGARGVVGPPLDQYGRRSIIAGSVANNEDNLVQFIVNPQSIRANSAMPVLGATEPEARDIAAYLYTLE